MERMQMPSDLEAAFNDQITLELASSIAYLQMAAYLESQSLTGMASWMRIQSDEERAHAIKFFDFVLDRGNTVAIGEIQAPEAETASPVDAFRQALDQERHVSESIRQLYRKATDTLDAASFPLLQWFLQEQVEEEATVSEIIDRLELAGSDGTALLQLDRELGDRAPGEDEGAG
jgi:ferritin